MLEEKARRLGERTKDLGKLCGRRCVHAGSVLGALLGNGRGPAIQPRARGRLISEPRLRVPVRHVDLPFDAGTRVSLVDLAEKLDELRCGVSCGVPSFSDRPIGSVRARIDAGRSRTGVIRAARLDGSDQKPSPLRCELDRSPRSTRSPSAFPRRLSCGHAREHPVGAIRPQRWMAAAQNDPSVSCAVRAPLLPSTR